MRLGLDIMGGDFAPQYPLEGVKLAMEAGLPERTTLVLFGPEKVINEELDKEGISRDQVEIIHAADVIEMGESPTKAISQKRDSSIMVGLGALKAGDIDIFMSAGNTGAMYVGALYTVKAIEGIQRPAIPSLLPREIGGSSLILDVGANADCKPETLFQFGVLGSTYAKCMMDIDDPKVALLNMGSEPEKGNLATQSAYNLLKGSSIINFVGNVEGYDIFSDTMDVVVVDGFTGNIVLKTAETIYQIMRRRGLADEYFHRYDYETYGGMPILGINAPVLIAHGVSTPEAFRNLVNMGIHVLDSRLTEKIKQAFELVA